MPTLSTTLAKNMLLKAQVGHKSRPAGGNFGVAGGNHAGEGYLRATTALEEPVGEVAPLTKLWDL
jgi:hypothetical protein